MLILRFFLANLYIKDKIKLNFLTFTTVQMIHWRMQQDTQMRTSKCENIM